MTEPEPSGIPLDVTLPLTELAAKLRIAEDELLRLALDLVQRVSRVVAPG